MIKRIAINGFGRIGRTLLRIISSRTNYEVVAINDLASPQTLSHLLKYDSIHGRFPKHIGFTEDCVIIDNKKINVLNKTKLSNLPWKDLGVDFVFECTGQFKTKEENQIHLQQGARRVFLSVPPVDKQIPMVVLGVNDHKINMSELILSNASCTTNCAAPMIKVLNDALGLESVYVTTVHSYTTDQNLHDGIHQDLRRARSATNSIIPTTTGAAKALSSIFPDIEIGGCGIRVPVANCSLTDITCVVKAKSNIVDINNLFQSVSNNKLKDILLYNDDPIVSIDVRSTPFSCVFDSKLTYVLGNMVKVVGWYDNEYGYCSRLVDLASRFS